VKQKSACGLFILVCCLTTLWPGQTVTAVRGEESRNISDEPGKRSHQQATTRGGLVALNVAGDGFWDLT
jgi:hypothetical protein